MKEEIKRIQNYVWARHIDGSDHYDHSIDETEAIKVLDTFYSEIGHRNDPDQVYLGILLFERAFECPDEQAALFERARKIFEFYKRVTGETDWPAVEDRLEDINMSLEDEAADAEPEPAAPTAVSDEPEPAPATPEPTPEPEAPAVAEAPAEEAAEAATETVEEPEAAEADAEEKTDEEVEDDTPRVAVTSAAEEEERRVAEKEAQRREAAEAFIADLEVVDGMELIPAGTFVYGNPPKEVFLDTFYIDKLPVTNEEYQRFVRETGYRAPRYAEDPRYNAPEQPVVGVGFGDAQQYAKWAGKDLPTEMQWEKAARGTDGRTYPWGNDPPGASDASFGQDPAGGAPVAAGQALRNVSPFGVLDMCGNVWEWTSSRFRKAGEYCVVRGGSFNDSAEYLALDFRLEAHPKDKCEVIGFRCVKNIHA